MTFRNGSTVVVEVVADPETRAQGLMYRPYLSPDRGMLFVFSEAAEHSFWMKNTLIPLDLLWLDEARTVVHVAENLPPCQADPCPSHLPGAEALYVLELAAGQVEARGVGIGDVLTFGGGIENIVPR